VGVIRRGRLGGDPHVRNLTRDIERDPKKVGEVVKRHYLTICITVHSGESE